MKRGRQLLQPVCALLLTAAGAAMPCAMAAVQDAQVQHMRENRLLDEVSLTLQKDGDAQDMLKLMAEPNIELYWDGETRMTAEEAANAARDFMQLTAEAGMAPELVEEQGQAGRTGNQETLVNEAVYNGGNTELYGGITVEPHLRVSQEESRLSGVLWECWGPGLPSGQIAIDDASGRMVGMTLFTENADPSNLLFSAEALDKAQRWADFLSEYYEVAMTVEFREDGPADYFDTYFAECSLSFPYGEGRTACRLLLEGWWENGEWSSVVNFNF